MTEARLNASMAVVVSKSCIYKLYLLNNPSPPLQRFFERPRIHRATHILVFISWELSAKTTLIVFPIVFPSVNTGALSHDERVNLVDKKYAAKEHRRKKNMDSIQNAQWWKSVHSGGKEKSGVWVNYDATETFRWAVIIEKLWLVGTRGPALACRPVGYRQHCDCRYSVRLATYNSSIWSDLLDINKSLSFNHIVSWRALLLRWLAVITSGGISKGFVL